MQTKVLLLEFWHLILSTVAVYNGGAGLILSSFSKIQKVYAWMDPDPEPRAQKAPAIISGDNIYIVWFTDKGTPNTNGEVIFRASNDGGATFGDKINLSNSNTTDSIDSEIASDGDTVVVTWWERENATSTEPVARISTDNGATFGPLITLATNGTINSSNEEDQ
jgi:hypothetical protein